MRYLIQFPAGLTPLVEQALDANCVDIHIVFADESALVFDSRTDIRSADHIPYAKNVFRVRAETGRRALASSIGELARNLSGLRTVGPAREPGFRIMYHIDGQLVSVESNARRSLEQAVGRASGMRLTPRGRCQEFWVVGRRELPVLYLVERLKGDETLTPARGSLSRELSALLVAATEPHPDDVFLDPFAGSGALVQARLRSPARSVIYNDLDLERFRSQFGPELKRRRAVTFLAEDALRMNSVEDGSIDVIATDPPWGEHDNEIGDYAAFATGISDAFKRVLKPKVGRAIVLVNRRNEEILEDALVDSSMTIYDKFPILVNGHPATAIRVQA